MQKNVFILGWEGTGEGKMIEVNVHVANITTLRRGHTNFEEMRKSLILIES